MLSFICDSRRTPDEPPARAIPKLFSDEPDMIPTRRFCELCGVSSKTVLRLIKARRLPGCKIGRAYFVPKTALIEYVTSGGGLDD